MPNWLPKILLAELILALILVSVPHSGKSASKVLADKTIAQSDSVPADTSGQVSATTDTPADTPAPTDQPADTATPTENPSPSDQATPVDTSSPVAAPTETASPTDQQMSPSPSAASSDQAAPSSPQVDTSTTGSTNTADSQTQQLATSAVLKPIEEITSPDNISEQAIKDAQDEDQQLNQAQSPDTQQKLLVHFADDKVTDIDHPTQNNDLATISFNTQRLANQLDKLITITSTQLTTSQQQPANADLQALCSKTNATLRSVQETVPDQMESDMETIRGKCLVQFGYLLDQ